MSSLGAGVKIRFCPEPQLFSHIGLKGPFLKDVINQEGGGLPKDDLT